MLTLAAFGLTSQEKTVLRSILVAKSSGFSSVWTFFLDENEAPEKPSAFLFSTSRSEGAVAMSRLAGRSIAVAILPPGRQPPADGKRYLKTPFRPQDIADTLNSIAMELRESPPPLEKREREETEVHSGDEVRLDIQAAFPGGGSRGNGLALAAYAVFQCSDRTQFYKIRKTGGGREVWCWPDMDVYWSTSPEEEISYDPDGEYEVWLCPEKNKNLEAKSSELRQAHTLLWRIGWKAKKTAELLPWVPAGQRISILSWPDMPKDMRTPSMIRAILRLLRSETTLSELMVEMKIPRKEACCMINAMIICGKAVAVQQPSRVRKPPMVLEPEEAIFLRSLAIVVFERLEDALSEEL